MKLEQGFLPMRSFVQRQCPTCGRRPPADPRFPAHPPLPLRPSACWRSVAPRPPPPQAPSRTQRLELWRARPMPHGARDRLVVELAPGRDRAEQQSAAAHVAPPDELGREEQTLPEDAQEHINVLR